MMSQKICNPTNQNGMASVLIAAFNCSSTSLKIKFYIFFVTTHLFQKDLLLIGAFNCIITGPVQSTKLKFREAF